MKEKRVDVNLAVAGFFQLLVIGFGSTAITEALKENSNTRLVAVNWTITLSACIITYMFYFRAYRLVKKSKR